MEPAAIQGGRAGMGPDGRAAPCVLVIFGASGDLTRRELLPALFELATQRYLPEPFAVIGFARSDWTDDEFRARMRSAVESECRFDAARWDRLARCLFYVRGDYAASVENDYAALRARIAQVQHERRIPDNVMFHLATPPSVFSPIVDRLDASGLATGNGWRRIVIEKPFGTDRASAMALDREIRRVFTEDQIYRIDHFLGKETVQNMLVVRFANPSLEPIWNRNYVDHVQITVAEDIGIGTRAGFYEKTGVVRDMVQNHLLQLLCITAIEPPGRFQAGLLRDETAKVLDAIRPVDVAQQCVRGQYGPGAVRGAPVVGYREERNVPDDSATSTYAALELSIENWRWAGVPFYLRTGKRMARKRTEVAIQFKPTPHLMFGVHTHELRSHVLVFRLQPEEGIIQTIVAKQPGPRIHLRPVTMSFGYASAFGITELPRAYAWLLLDVMEGDQTLFARADWIDRAWEIVDPVIAHWDEVPPDGFPNYAAGSWGPRAAEDLLGRAGRVWRAEEPVSRQEPPPSNPS